MKYCWMKYPALEDLLVTIHIIYTKVQYKFENNNNNNKNIKQNNLLCVQLKKGMLPFIPGVWNISYIFNKFIIH